MISAQSDDNEFELVCKYNLPIYNDDNRQLKTSNDNEGETGISI